MNFPCRLGIHDWHHCKCRKCGSRRDTDHLWEGCKCAVCGITRDEGHQWKGCKCPRCGKTRDEGHQWAGCTCKVCGITRNVEHDWDGCRCRRCKAVRNGYHKEDVSSVLPQMEPARKGYALRAKKKHIAVMCSKCGKCLRFIETDTDYCPKCLHEIQVSCAEWGGTSMKYTAECKSCGYNESFYVSDSY